MLRCVASTRRTNKEDLEVIELEDIEFRVQFHQVFDFQVISELRRVISTEYREEDALGP